MNKDTITGNWKQFRGNIREKWGKLTDDDMATIGGKWDRLIGMLQEKYGVAREEAERQVRQLRRAS